MVSDPYGVPRAVYAVWRLHPSQENRRALRDAIRAAGGTIEGHGVLAWARKHLTRDRGAGDT